MQTLGAVITIKLDQDNYILWRSLALPALYNLDLYGFVDGKTQPPSNKIPATDGGSETMDNLEYTVWFRTDQQILSGLRASLTPMVMGACAASRYNSTGMGSDTSQTYLLFQTLCYCFTSDFT